MAQSNTSDSGGGSSVFMAFVIGALVVAVGVLGYFMFMGGSPDSKDINLKIEAPKE